MNCAGVNCSQKGEHNTNEDVLALEISSRFRYYQEN